MEPREDQTIILDHGTIAVMGPSATTVEPAAARAIDLAGSTVTPGLVGMHEHLFYPWGVTSGRTAGSLEY